MNPYVGNAKQIRGCEKFARLEGKAAGMEFYRLRNGKGLEMEISLSRNGDISSLSYKGMNLSYLSPCGYVGPAYYNDKGDGFLKSFTAETAISAALRFGKRNSPVDIQQKATLFK